MKLFRTSIILLSAGAMLLAACEKGPDGYTVDKDAVVLEAYGPNPVLRGSDLKFVGQNLDRITSVILPVDIEIPSSEFKDASASSFNVTVPIECEPGEVVLVYDGGTITAKTTLSYTEQFSISSVAPKDETKTVLEAGDSVRVDGEYLNNIVRFVFVNGGAVAEGELIGTHTRHQICFAVPAGAMTGRIYGEDGNGNQVYSENELQIRQPEVTGVAPFDGVRPGDKITVTGSLLDQIMSVTFAGSAAAIEAAAFENASATSFTLTVPSDVHDGPLTLVSAAEQKISTTQSIVVAVPENLAFADGNQYKAGNSIVITGTNLDLVTGVTFSGNAAGEFTYSDGSLSVTIPASASDGEITLSTAAEKTVTTSSVTLVKPVITGHVSEVKAGDTFTISGTALDLVTGVTLNGVECTFTADSDSQLTVNTTASSTSGKVAVSAANGYTAVSGTELTVTYDSIVIVSSLTESVKPGESVTMTGSNFNMIESIYVGETKVISYTSRSDSEVTFEMPEVEAGTYNLEFVLTTGDRETCPIAIEVTGESATIPVGETDVMLMDFEGDHNHTAWAGGSEIVSENGNNYLRINSVVNPNGSGAWILNCNDFPDSRSVDEASDYVLRIDIFVPEGWTDPGTIYYQFVFSGWHWYGANMLAPLQGNGTWQTLEIPLSFWLLSGSLEMAASSEVGLFLDGSSTAGLPVGMCFDNMRLSPAL